MFFGNVLLDKSGPYALLWKAVHGNIKSIPRTEIKNFDAVQKCENLLEKLPEPLTQINTTTKFSLYLISNLLYGIVIVVKRQGDILLVDAEELRASFSIFAKTKRKRLFFGDVSNAKTPKRSRFIQDMLVDNFNPVTDYNDPMNKLDQAFLNNRIEVAQLDDITLKEPDFMSAIPEKFSDAVTDFGENSTERQQIFSNAGIERSFRDIINEASTVQNLQIEKENQNDENCNKTTQAVTESAVNVTDAFTVSKQDAGPALQSVENVNSEFLKESVINDQQDTVFFILISLIFHGIFNQQPQLKKRKMNKRFRKQHHVCDKETTIPLEKITERIKNTSLYQRSPSSLFDSDNNEACVKSLFGKKFATTIANRLFGEEWVPKPRGVNPMSFEEALRHGRNKDMSESALDKILDMDFQNDKSVKERARNSSTTFLRISTSKSTTTSELVDDLKISSILDSPSAIPPKISEPLDSISLDEETEAEPNQPKISDLLLDISVDSDVTIQDDNARKSLPEVPKSNQENALNLNVSRERNDDISQVQNATLLDSRTIQNVSFNPPITEALPKITVYTSCTSSDKFFQQIKAALESNGDYASFSELVQFSSRATAARSFSLLLTLIKERKVEVVEEEPYGDIKISLANA
uniref:Rad21_Rec8_N domain-containing protein n=1 Tax=Syphacia muris TaxID=451379 RepID=A0A158R5J3_9BILA